MEFDQSLANNYSYLSRIFSEHPCKKSEIPTMVPVQPNTTVCPTPSHDTAFLYQNNYNNFKQHPLNGAKHYSNFSMEGPSSISQFCMIPTPSFGGPFKATRTSGSMTDFLKSSHPMGVAPNSTLSPNPSHDSAFLHHNNYHNFKQHPLSGAKHYSSFSMEGPSSISQFCMIPTPSFGGSIKATHTSGSMTDFLISSHPMGVSPNNNKTEVMHGYLNSGINYLDFINSIPLQYNAISQSQVGLSLSPLFCNDTPASIPMKPMLQDELSHNVGCGKSLPNTDLILDVDDQKKQSLVEMKNNESYQSDTSRMIGQWEEDEDRVLTDLVNQYGPKKWSQIAKFIDGRNGKQCRKRWINHLRPNIRKDSLSEDEEKILIEAHKILGNKWEQIARRLPGRAENTIKNYWNNIRRRVNGKRKQNGSKDGSKGTLLEKYIQEVTNTNAD